MRNIYGEKGSNICCKCKAKCCVRLAPPYLTTQDIEIIEKGLGLKSEKFVIRKKDSNGKFITCVKPNSEGVCAFYSKGTGKCDIYEFRPVDCVLFPLEIVSNNGKNYWQEYKFCDLESNKFSNIFKKAEKFIKKLNIDVDSYAKIKMSIPESWARKNLSPIFK